MSLKTPTRVNLACGAKGPDVEALRAYLAALGYLITAGQIDHFTRQPLAGVIAASGKGTFGADVESALYQFQISGGLPPTGTLTAETIDLMSRPRCGCADTVRTTNLNAKWNQPNVRYRFDQFSSKLTRVQVSEAIRAATALWAAIVPLHFTEVEGTADTSIRFKPLENGNDLRSGGGGGILAQASYPPDNYVHFDDEQPWTVTQPVRPDAQDLVTQAAHELGHSLGLSHSADPSALMYFAPTHVHRFLSPDDISRVQLLYSAVDLDLRLEQRFSLRMNSVLASGDFFTISGTGEGNPGFCCHNGSFMRGETGNREIMRIVKEPKTGFDDVIRDGDRVNIKQLNQNRWWYVAHNELLCDPMEQFKWTFTIRKTTPLNPSDTITLDNVIRIGDTVRLQNVTQSEYSPGGEWIAASVGFIGTVTF